MALRDALHTGRRAAEKGGMSMTGYGIRITIKDGEVEKIMKEIDEAQMKLYDCYKRLKELGIVTIEKTADENAGGQKG